MAIAIQAVDDTPTLDELKLALGITVSTNDVELQQILDDAMDAYTEAFGVQVGTQTDRFDGGRDQIVLPLTTTEVTAAAYTDDTVIDVADLYYKSGSGLLKWGYNTAGYFTYGVQNVVLTYTVGLPRSHKREILSDAAGYWTQTQRGSGSVPFNADGFSEAYEGAAPLSTFPRILALARRYSTGVA